MLTPAGTPRDIINRLNAELGKIVATAEMKAKLLDQGADPVTMTPEQIRAFLKSELAKWTKVVKTVGIKLE
jgi:tripartite-type tricarboxylate transporter receptor subunit TctC